ncbi:cytochrome P450 [Elsinoe ampelina]|uniref:Cytochrome P450 n=1 Tax=Elsinoe ampelina TaxID=302913 RepID=A0A6A6FZU9_9PEZI|nr:cytochrome P450 [Elsinoe ampelina]
MQGAASRTMDTSFNTLVQYPRWETSLWVLLCASIFGLVVRTIPRSSLSKFAPPRINEETPIFGALRFFSARADFCKDNSKASKTGNYSFYVGPYLVVGLSGSEGRKAFYDSKELSLFEGYAALLTATPGVNISENGVKFDSWFARKITKTMKKDNLVRSLRHLVSDTEQALKRSLACNDGTVGYLDPFVEMNRIVYLLTLRTVGVKELADAPDLLDYSLRLVEVIDDNNSTAKIIIPWFPATKHIKRLLASTRFFLLINRIVRDRKRTGRREDDTLQTLIDDGESIMRTVLYVINALLAALLNSGMNVAWVLCYLATEPEWQQRIHVEIDAAVAKHRTSSSQSSVEVLKSLTLEDWESEFPLTNLCLHESIRLQTVGAAFRKNVSDHDVQIGSTGHVIPKGAYAAFHIDDIHMNPDIYSDPTKYDPARYLPDRAEDKRVPHAFGGWGNGRHPCLGMRFAKIENAVIIATFISMFDYSVCNLQGEQIKRLPVTDRNGFALRKPQGLRLRCTRRSS